MNKERDKLLTEVMGECWHDFQGTHIVGVPFQCVKCKSTKLKRNRPTFSTPEGFFKLKDYLERINKLDPFFEWYVAEKRKDFFGISIPCQVEFFKKCMLILLKTPDRFADAVYEFLKEDQDGYTND